MKVVKLSRIQELAIVLNVFLECYHIQYNSDWYLHGTTLSCIIISLIQYLRPIIYINNNYELDKRK